MSFEQNLFPYPTSNG